MTAHFNLGKATTFLHYARPVPAPEVWGTGFVNGTTNQTTGEITFPGIVSGKWRVHRTDNLSNKLNTDADVGGFEMDSEIAATEVQKIPRSTTTVSAGAATRRTKINATSTVLDETIGPVP